MTARRLGEAEDLLHVAHLAVEVDRDDRPRARRRSPPRARRCPSAPSPGPRRRARASRRCEDRGDRRHAGVRLGDHLVPRADAEPAQGELDRVGAGGDPDRLGAPMKAANSRSNPSTCVAQHEPARSEHLGDRRVELRRARRQRRARGLRRRPPSFGRAYPPLRPASRVRTVSFRRRLTLFFVLIVVLPMVALAAIVVELAGSSQTGKADAASRRGSRPRSRSTTRIQAEAEEAARTPPPTRLSRRRSAAATRRCPLGGNEIVREATWSRSTSSARTAGARRVRRRRGGRRG